MTVESLLKLKRAERPSPEFWTQFERELRVKQLAAIVEKRPWWCAIPALYVFVLRHRLSLAAASSALAIGLVSFNAYQPSLPEAAPPSASDFQPASVSAPEAAQPVTAVQNASVRAPSAVVMAAPVENTGRNSRPAARMAVSPAQALPVIPLLDDMPQSGATERFDAISRAMAGDLAAAGASAPQGSRGLQAGSRDFGFRAVPVRAAVAEPLAQMQAPSEGRSRLLAEVYPAMAAPAGFVSPASERVLSRLSDDRLYSSGGRYDLATERDAIKLSIRF